MLVIRHKRKLDGLSCRRSALAGRVLVSAVRRLKPNQPWYEQELVSTSFAPKLLNTQAACLSPKLYQSRPNLSSPKPGHTTGERVGAHGRAAGRGWAGRDADRTVRKEDKRPSYLPRHRRNVS